MPLWTSTGFLLALAALSKKWILLIDIISSPVILDDVPQVMLTVIKQQPDFSVCVREEDLDKKWDFQPHISEL